MAMEWNPPVAPEMNEYNSMYGDQLQSILDRLNSKGPYESSYQALIDETLSKIMNRSAFSYDADSDMAYQGFIQRAERMGDKALADNLGQFASMTGGRLNSWAGTIATQSKNEFLGQALEALPMFEDRAYQRYRDEGNDLYNLLGTLNDLDTTGYNRWRDTITDQQQMFGMVMQLDDREFRNFEYMTNQKWQQYNAEYQSFNDSLVQKGKEIDQAYERTKILGYVSNEDSVILGVPAGTPSFQVQEREAQMKQWIEQEKIRLENDFKKMEKQHRYDKSLINARSSGGGASSGGQGGSLPKLNSEELSIANSTVQNAIKILTSSNYSDTQKANLLKRVVSGVERNMGKSYLVNYGDNRENVGTYILMRLAEMPQVQALLG